MLRIIGNQFRKPTGLLGRIISMIMIKGNSYAYNKIIPELDIKLNDRILEIGYGHGLGVDMIASGFDCFVSGIDFSELMFNEATKRNMKHINNKKVELCHGDFLSSEIISNQYDKIFCINVIYFWDKLDEPFSKIKKGLKKGGIFCIHMAHRDDLEKMKFTKDAIFNKYTIEEVVNSLKLSGFEEVRYEFDKGYLITCKK
jgi:cyclopropane fatty-acyl-phospholipid synthase-like methyltransferase